MTDRKKPGVAFWATVVLVVVLGYPLSFGPVFWVRSRARPRSRGGVTDNVLQGIYWPLGRQTGWGPQPVRKILTWYLRVGVPRDIGISVPVAASDPDEWLYMP